jgi:hypothetical protein
MSRESTKSMGLGGPDAMKCHSEPGQVSESSPRIQPRGCALSCRRVWSLQTCPQDTQPIPSFGLKRQWDLKTDTSHSAVICIFRAIKKDLVASWSGGPNSAAPHPTPSLPIVALPPLHNKYSSFHLFFDTHFFES